MELNLNTAAAQFFCCRTSFCVRENAKSFFTFAVQLTGFTFSDCIAVNGEVSRIWQAVMIKGVFGAFKLPWEVSEILLCGLYLHQCVL